MFKNVLKNKEFVFYTLQMFFTMGILFSYISASPFIIQEHYKFSPIAFSLFFAANAAAIGTGAAISSRFKNYEKSLKTGSTGMIICSILLLCILAINGSIVFFEGLLFVLCFMMGLTFPVTISFALNSAKKQSGTASAIIGASGFLAGSIVSPIVGLGNILISTGIAFTVSSAFAGLSAYLASRQRKEYKRLAQL
jgi:DHA1 family bicyclomycin/chloramphenicol resistance-like MFS transporter